MLDSRLTNLRENHTRIRNSLKMSPHFSPTRLGCFSGILVILALPETNAVNIAPQGTGSIGVHTSIGTDFGVPFEHAGFASNLNDLNFNSSVDTFNGGGTERFSFAGVLFSPPRTDLVTSFTLHVAAFFDGGWFGPNFSGPGASGQLAPNYLTEPTVQVTFDSGATWANVPASSNYVSALNGTPLPVAFGPATHASPAVFNLTTPQTGISGIRLIGSEGGTASGGFLGVYEIEVEAVPEPSGALALISGAGVLALLSRRTAASRR